MDGMSILIQSNQEFKAEIKGPLATIADKIVIISIQDKSGNSIDQLKMKVANLSTGPVRHDHLLKNLKSRLLFDCNIDQYLNVGLSLQDFQINWEDNMPCQ